MVGVAKKLITVLEMVKITRSRKDLLFRLSLVNNPNNFENYIKLMIDINRITTTIPDKPTSPNPKGLRIQNKLTT